MNHEQKHKEDLEAAKGWLAIAKENNNTIAIQILEKFFPELRESEDEKIRKGLIEHLNELKKQSVEGSHLKRPEHYDAWIAWLEKQGKKTIPKNIDDAALQYVDTCAVDGKFTHGNITEPCWNNHSMMAAYKAGWLEKQGKEEYALKSSKDEDVRKFMQQIKKEAKAYEFNLPNRDYDIYAFAKDILAWLERQGEQNPTDKVEPKFKVGDWVVYCGKTCKITGLNNGIFTITNQDGSYFFNQVKSTMEPVFHHWTIQDAKDGDVLAEHETIVLFKKIEGQNIRCYCTYHYLGFNTTFYVGTLQNKTPYCPATKEQCDLLFQKMKEEGYEWDAEKKELKNIEKRCERIHAEWSEKDEENLNWVINVWNRLRRGGDAQTTPNQMEMLENWLKTLKDKVQPQLKQEWSKKDEDAWRTLLFNFENMNRKYLWGDGENCYAIDIVNFLKSLKPQKHWKPSEYDISLLEEIARNIRNNVRPFCSEVSSLEDLIENLKKL